MSNIIISDKRSIQRIRTDAPVVLTNSSGAEIMYKMSPWNQRDLETLDDEGVVTIPPGMVVEIFPTVLESATLIPTAFYEDANFEDVRDLINTESKYAGKFMWDITTGAPVWSAGSSTEDVWVDSAGATVYTPVGVPDAFVESDWSLADPSTSGDLTVTISTLPYDGNSTLTDLEYRIDGGSAVSFGAAIADDYTISGLTDDVEVDIEIRAVNAVGDGEWSDVKSDTPTV